MAAAVSRAVAAATTLEGPFDTRPSPAAIQPTPATVNLVKSQVQALLLATPSYHELAAPERTRLEDRLVYIASYAAECMRDVCWQSRQLGQTPLVRKREAVTGLLARAQEEGFQPKAAGQIARITQEQLKAIAFPTFVADLIRGTFDAIVRTSIQQMEAFVQMIENVSKTVDQFMADNISDNQARDWLAARYPEHIRIEKSQAVPVPGSDSKPLPDFRRDLKLEDDVSGLDSSSIDEVLVPGARRRLAENRLQILSTLVLMGVNRIVVTAGKIRATMAFHIDTTDRLHEEHASDLDARTAAAGSYGYGPWSVSASMSVSYVSSTRGRTFQDVNVNTDLTGEVELHFKSDFFPVERFANTGVLGAIRQNTAAPDKNQPSGDATTGRTDADGIQWGGDVTTTKLPPPDKRDEPLLPPIAPPPSGAKAPVEPTEPKVTRWEADPEHPDAKGPEGAVSSQSPDKDKKEDKPETAPDDNVKDQNSGDDKKSETAPDAAKKPKTHGKKKAEGETTALSWSPLL